MAGPQNDTTERDADDEDDAEGECGDPDALRLNGLRPATRLVYDQITASPFYQAMQASGFPPPHHPTA